MEMNFYRAALIAVTIFFVGCDEAPKPAQTAQSATVLEGKTMGTFWRVSAVGVDAKRARSCRRRSRLSLMLTISFFQPIKMILP